MACPKFFSSLEVAIGGTCSTVDSNGRNPKYLDHQFCVKMSIVDLNLEPSSLDIDPRHVSWTYGGALNHIFEWALAFSSFLSP